jgi:subtilisin family serine protease
MPTPSFGGLHAAETTGRFIVVFKDAAAGDAKAINNTLKSVTGVKSFPTSDDFKTDGVAADVLSTSSMLQFNTLGVALVANESAMLALAASASDANSPILVCEPEYIAYPSPLPEGSLEYLRGYRDAVNQLYDQLAGDSAAALQAAPSAALQDTSSVTWGLQATKAHTSPQSGAGVKVAVLDTGFDFNHPDFAGRAIFKKSFVAGVSEQDIFGHGTHCIGTACGPKAPSSGVRRYGIAHNAQIFVAKVFNNNTPRPGAATGDIIAALDWAVQNGCQVASLSLSIPIDVQVQQYVVPIRRALANNTLVVCAAGNNADRPSDPGFVEPPANADDAMAVAAIDKQFAIARFSARSSTVTGDGGKVNIAGPGVGVFSSVPGGHQFFDGTSMATPHVAGIAALWCQKTGETGSALWSRLMQSVQPLSLSSLDVGAGLVQAPQ